MNKRYVPFAVAALLITLAAGHWLARTATVAAETSVSVTGMVKFEGTAPKPTRIDMSSDPNCAKSHPSPGTTEDVVVGAGGVLENAVVYISGGLEGRNGLQPGWHSLGVRCRLRPSLLGGSAADRPYLENVSHGIHRQKQSGTFLLGQLRFGGNALLGAARPALYGQDPRSVVRGDA